MALSQTVSPIWSIMSRHLALTSMHHFVSPLFDLWFLALSKDSNTVQATFSSFLTVTVSGIRQDPAPGDDNPLIPLALGQQLADKEKDSKGKAIGTTLSSEFFEISAAMNAFKADREAPSWWDYRPESQVDEMTYECDTKLGSPRSVDCSKLEYSQLGAGSDTIQISPQVPRILSTGM